jgi:molybdopterin/thiamine biosynthesis adenylyltransferase
MSKNNKVWFEEYPEILQKELDTLSSLEVEYLINEEAKGLGLLILELTINETNCHFALNELDKPLHLTVVFPDNYPFFRPEVQAKGLSLPRHQNPLSKGLCLIPRNTSEWEPQWTLGRFLKSQLPKTITKGNITDPESIAADPTEQAEPISEYYGNLYNNVLFDSNWTESIPITNDEISYLGEATIGFPRKATIPSRMAVLESYGTDKKLTSQLPESLKSLFPQTLKAPIVRLKSSPMGNAHQALEWLRILVGKSNQITTLNRKPLPPQNGVTLNGVIGLNFPEEIAPGVVGMGWLFLVYGNRQTTIQGQGKKSIPAIEPLAYFAKVSRLGQKDLQLRVPKLNGIQDKKIAIVGLGAIGAPSAFEFARNQVGQLNIMDFDIVDAATSVRWPLGIFSAGKLKTDAIYDFIQENYPKTLVNKYLHKIGNISSLNELLQTKRTEQDILDEFLDGVSLLYDASAEVGVSHFLSEEAKKRGIPYVCLYGTHGALGGSVMRVVPGKGTGCWMCLEYHKTRGSIPIPVKDDAGEIQAAGCGDLTFTGASFDMQNIVLAGVRLSIATLLSTREGGYPDMDWDVGILSLVDADKKPIAPSWETSPLHIHPECPYCNAS